MVLRRRIVFIKATSCIGSAVSMGASGMAGPKYYYVSAETALLVLLINLVRPVAFCDMQASLNGMPSPEISLVVNFMLTYVEPWCAVCQDLSVFLPRFHLYADVIVAKGSRIGAGNMYCRIVAFTDGTLIPTCRPHGNGNHRHNLRMTSTSTGCGNNYRTHTVGWARPRYCP